MWVFTRDHKSTFRYAAVTGDSFNMTTRTVTVNAGASSSPSTTEVRLRRPRQADDPAHVVRPKRLGVEGVGAAVAGDEQRVVPVANEMVREVKRRERGCAGLTALTWLRTERGVGVEQRGAVVGLAELYQGYSLCPPGHTAEYCTGYLFGYWWASDVLG